MRLSLAVLSALTLLGSVLAAPSLHPDALQPRDADMAPHAWMDDQALEVLTIPDAASGTRNLTYFEPSIGGVIVHGDMWFPSLDDLLEFETSSQQGKDHAMTYTNRPWPKATVPFRYVSDEAERKTKSKVEFAINAWGSGAPYLQFVRIVPNGEGSTGIIRISAREDGCYASGVGYRKPTDRYRVNLANACSKGNTVHEFGHILGFAHEHQRPDRENHIHFVCANVDPGPKCTMPPQRNCCDQNLPNGCCKNRYQFSYQVGMTFDGPYDLDSVMHYAKWAFALPGRDTLVPVAGGKTMPDLTPSTPSRLDFAALCRSYPKECKR
ncbi:zincin [Sporormia fimetaria CBS 119925]|uniref:Metalloendopeptidase n=1 Tax=Sporormia fimetaria CBS 119925 TaxID=1340428 RepID=A0A6A6UW80_9PLEO|nr:zincin [Sporormia fimetaria CBS 119925]